MNAKVFINDVAERLRCDTQRAEGLVLVIFRALRARLTPKEASDVAAQLPTQLKHMWLEDDQPNRRVERTHKEEFIGNVRNWAGLPDDHEAERAVRAVFGELQRSLGSPSGTEGEAWHIFSQLPKDLKRVWLAAAENPEA